MTTLPRTLLILAIAGSTVVAYGQGTVYFNTQTLGTNARVYDGAAHGSYLLGSTNYGPGAQGTNWFAQLYAAAGTGAPSSALVPVGQPVNFRSGLNAGYVQASGTTTLGWAVNPLIAIPFLSPGGPITLQLRVWWGGGTQITSFEAATASSNPNSRWGASPLVYLASTGNPIGSPPTTPADLIGLLGFSIGETQPARPPVVTVQPQGEVAYVGANVILNVAAIGVLPMSYQWSFNGAHIAGATAASLALANVQPAQAGSYAVVVSNADGSAASSDAVLTIIPAPPCAAPPAGLVSWWRAETNTEDWVSGNHGTLKGGASFGLGKVGYAFDFAATNSMNQYVELPNNDLLNPPGSFSIEGWIYPRSGGGQYLFSKWGDNGDYKDDRSYALGINNRGLYFNISDAAHQLDTPFQTFGVNNVVTLNAWSHVAAVYDQPTGIRRLYLNGVQIAAKTNAPIAVLKTSLPVRIGANYFASPIDAYPFNGLIDEISFYNVALSGDDIQAIYAAASVGKCAEPIPPFIITQPASPLVITGSTVTLTALAGGTPPLSYQWRFAGTNIAGATAPTLSLTNVQPAQAGNYTVAVTNAVGAAVSSNALLTIFLSWPCVPAPAGLVSWWAGDSSAVDSVSGNHGLPETGLAYALGEVGQAFAFNGTNASVRIPANSNLDLGLGDGLTLEAWINPASVASERPILEWNSGSQTNPNGVLFWMSIPANYWTRGQAGTGPGSLLADLVDTTGQSHWFGAWAGVLTSNVFQHVALTYDKSTGMGTIYVNGVAVAEEDLGRFTPQTSYDLYLGFRPAGWWARTHWRGQMDEVSLYRRALSAGEIQFLYNVGSMGKCKEPADIVNQPVSQRVNVGTDAQFNVVATGSLTLHYQWLKAGVLLPGATGTSLALANVRDADAGIYSVDVTNSFGSVISSNALLAVNHPPVADASATVPMVISANRLDATVILNGSRSSDPDGDPLRYSWSQTGVADALATGIVAVVTLPVGTNSITLTVDDGLATGTQTVSVVVITPAQAVARLMGWVVAQTGDRLNARVGAQVPRIQPLLALLSAAMAALDRGDLAAAINQLQAFQNKVRAQLGPVDAVLADQLIQAAQEIVDIISASNHKTLAKITNITRQANGKVRMWFPANPGQLFIVESSNDLVNWERIGVATDDGKSLFEFEDAQVAQVAHQPTRFYRVVSP